MAKWYNWLKLRLNSVLGNLHSIDSTLSSWQSKLANFSSQEKCDSNLVLEFMSHFSTSVNRTFYSMVRLTEIQDILTQLSHLTNNELVGYSHSTCFITTELSSRLSGDSSIPITNQPLDDGFPLVLNPMVTTKHSGKQLELSLLLNIPEIPNHDSFCTIEYLSPIKCNISGTCYTAPIPVGNLDLITCSETKSLVKADSLTKFFQQDNTLVCPHHVLHPARTLDWLGMPWTMESCMSFQRNHQKATDCADLHLLLHLGGCTYLSITTSQLNLNRDHYTPHS